MADDGLPAENKEVTPSTSESGKRTNGKDLHVRDPRGYTVSLRMDTWERHIITGHPEMRDKLELLARTLSEPEVIIEREQGLTGFCFYYRLTGRSFHRHDDIYMSVVVEVDEASKSGEVKTAHLVKTIKKGNLIWMKRN